MSLALSPSCSSVRPATPEFHEPGLLIQGKTGIFVGNADGSILLATHAIIASEFNDLKNSSWLITSFALAGAATQALVRPSLQ